MWNVGETRLRLVIHQLFIVFSQHPKRVATLVNQQEVRSIAFIKESLIFHGFSGVMNRRFWTNQCSRNISVIINEFINLWMLS